MKYIKQLDSIRAIAVLIVIISHWFSSNNPLYILTSIINGVDIFFVLSGFLITKILLANRMEAEEFGTKKTSLIKSFFMRRTLRIFPIYYILIFSLYLLDFGTEYSFREDFLYFFTYTSNLHFFDINHWEGRVSHLWSLAVEEQFYLVWPWLILFINKRYFLHLFSAFILIGICSQFIFMDRELGSILTLSCFDGFGFGALLAWISVYKPNYLNKLYIPSLALVILCLVLQILRVVTDSWMIFSSRTITSLFTVAVIIIILLGKEKKFILSNLILNNRVLIFLGKISYGIYLYHNFIPRLTKDIFSKINAYIIPGGPTIHFYVLFVENLCLLVLVSFASWKLLEQPILRYKDKFEYQKLSKVRTGKISISSQREKVS
jgi:peptidoglycan/LPS O-acetylase OafA/YrhL